MAAQISEMQHQPFPRTPYIGKEEYLHAFMLCAFAVSHPLLEVLTSGPEFFVVRGSARKDIAAMLLLLFAGLPAF